MSRQFDSRFCTYCYGKMTCDPSQTRFAHSTPSPDTRTWEPLETHLWLVAARAAEFAGKFGAAEWGRAAGLWHDIGKYSDAFQQYLAASAQAAGSLAGSDDAPARGRVDHSTAGAVLAQSRDAQVGRLLAYVIAGHHAGLADRGDRSIAGSIEARLAKTDPSIADGLARAPARIRELSPPAVPALTPTPHLGDISKGAAAFSLALFTRMVFSTLVDADYLETERFLSRDRSDERRSGTVSAELAAAIEAAIDDARTQRRTAAGRNAAVQGARDTVVRDCVAAAGRPPGFFTLTVPTGGGKTLASMLFALRHAAAHGLRRVIVAVPFTSIIDQNAGIYAEALGPGNVLEHHSNLDPKRDSRWRELGSENWDAPVVVTTTVQLFESLFAARPSACRKLHNLARSVIVLDEAQALPPPLLSPILAALRQLVANYGCSVVMSTATQPALGQRPEFPIGVPLKPSDEIIRDVDGLFAILRRTRVHATGPMSDQAVAARLAGAPAGLVIANTRKHAAGLFQLVREHDHSALHLSALMCAEHRRVVLKEVRARLNAPMDARRPCRVVSTQVVEAGVDVDFPLVLRALAGLDSIAQSAGRCNREGALEHGVVEVFTPDAASEGGLPAAIRRGRDAVLHVLDDHAGDLLAPAAIDAYFRQLYFQRRSARAHDPFDIPGVLGCFSLTLERGRVDYVLNFATAEERFAMIEPGQRGVIVPYGPHGAGLIDRLRAGDIPDRPMWRQLQTLSVNVYRPALEAMSRGLIEETRSGVLVLVDPKAYDPATGLRLDFVGLSPELFVL